MSPDTAQDPGFPGLDPSYDVDPRLLVAHCASPLVEGVAADAVFSSGGADSHRNVFGIKLENAGAFQLLDKDRHVFFTVSPDAKNGALAVTAKDASGADVDDGFSCTTVTTEKAVSADGLAGTYTRKSLHVSHLNLSAKLTWYLSSGAGVLTRIEVDDDDGEDDAIVLSKEGL